MVGGDSDGMLAGGMLAGGLISEGVAVAIGVTVAVTIGGNRNTCGD